MEEPREPRNEELYAKLQNDLKQWLMNEHNSITISCNCKYNEYNEYPYDGIYVCSNCSSSTNIVIALFTIHNDCERVTMDITIENNKFISIALYPLDTVHTIIFDNNNIYLDECFVFDDDPPKIKLENIYDVDDLYHISESRVIEKYGPDIVNSNEYYCHYPYLSSIQQILDDINPNKKPNEIIIEI